MRRHYWAPLAHALRSVPQPSTQAYHPVTLGRAQSQLRGNTALRLHLPFKTAKKKNASFILNPGPLERTRFYLCIINSMNVKAEQPYCH